MIDYTRHTLGELLTNSDNVIQRNAVSILKRLQRKQRETKCPKCGGNVWDIARGSKLNKCWDCGLAFD